jgi:dinuclear metal center YbgI/SA1388 family protein
LEEDWAVDTASNHWQQRGCVSVRLSELIAFLDATLEVERFRDYGPNGLQVEANGEVERVVTGVSANAALVAAAAAQRAHLLVVHHGLIWGAGIERVTGVLARRLTSLFEHRISLAAYHLPLDKHANLGNNAGLADAMGLGKDREWFGDVRGHALGLAGAWPQPLARTAAIARVADGVLAGRPAPFVFPYGPERVAKVGVCSGAASELLESAVAAGCDLFVTGELAERAGEVARELGITLVAAGHYATEVFGPKRLADAIRMRFPGVQAGFVDVPSPL